MYGAPLAAGNYIGGMGRMTPRLASPRFAGRTGSNVRGVVLDDLLGRHSMDVTSIRMGRLGDGIDVCTDRGWNAAGAVTSSLLNIIGSAIEASATGSATHYAQNAGEPSATSVRSTTGTVTTTTTDSGRVTAGRLTSGAGDLLAAGYAAACAPSPGSGATSPAVGSPTNAEITALLTATRDELASTREAATNAEIERARAEAANTQRTQQYLMIGGGVALLALVAVVALRK